ncbi:acetyl-CoA carboxylase biotin carboxylase subunit family protein [Arthrobacter sp. NPDC090010]|uniref:ATP-grasp domain-containing protein n=1 Tax=Arthrobacter sp. NPDC090010 TaxID=3363942 RepID=UPI0037FE59A6
MTIVVLGFREGLVEAAAEFGDVLVIADHQKPGLEKHRHLMVDDIASIDMVTAALGGLEGFMPSAVVTAHEQGVSTCHQLRRRYRHPAGASSATVLRFRDKKVQKDALAPATPRARCEELDIFHSEYSQAVARVGDKFVLKPADGFGSVATRIVASEAEYDSFRAEFSSRGSTRFLAESYISGDEWHVDGVWSKGSFRWSAVSAYTNPPITWVQGQAVGGVPLAGAEDVAEQAAISFVTETLTQLEAPDAVVHVEIFRRPDGGYFFSEAAIRVAGAFVPEVLDLTFGRNLYRAEVELALGLMPETAVATPINGVFGYTYLLRTEHSTKTEAQLFQEHQILKGEYPSADRGRAGAYGRWGYAILRGDDHPEVVHRLGELTRAAEGVPS